MPRKSVRWRERGSEEPGSEEPGNPGTGVELFPLAVEGRAPGFCVARVAIWGAENGPSKSPH
jgi:hypothetical protein